VQKAINRVQSFDLTKRAIDLCREAGIGSVNIDLIYGLPYQVRASISRTVEQVIALSPDRIAVFGYAHLPSRFKHQQLIPDQALPGPVERFGQASRAARMLVASGYVQIGLDHYAKADDALGQSEVRRNFQGYTTDGSEILIGLGASAIGRLPQGYVQNAVARADYGRRIDDGGLATVRGKALSDEDRMRAHVIERLMCAFEFDRDDLRQRYGAAAAPLIDEAEGLVAADHDGLLQATDSGFRITRYGRPFTRTVCSTFDAYLGGGATHSSGV